MKISDLFSRQSIYGTERSNDSSRVGNAQSEQSSRGKGGEGEDRVSISPMARRFKQVSEIVREDEELRAQRVQALKAQVESGKYQVSSTDVAKSVVSFVKEASAS